MITPLYNGNISETFWKTESDNIKRNYGYQYDNLNRLTNSIYQKENVATNSYNEMITYDPNGNITTMYRTGYQDGSDQSIPFEIDNLFYGYASNSNKLLSVYDQSLKLDGFRDGNLNGVDFEYDLNGNMVKDRNKKILSIKYNHLNLPTTINFENGSIINYIYNALGVKLAKKATSVTSTESTLIADVDYLGGFQYQMNQLSFFPTAEGYVSVVDGNKFNYVFNYTDHLGNIRLSYTQSGTELKILEENHYYPFGLKHSNYNTDIVRYKKDVDGITIVLRPTERSEYQYKYNGKELQDELGLNMTAMDYRQYDMAIGRFNSIDNLTELVPGMSPYRFAFNNPNFWSDPTGLLEQNSENLAHCPTCPNTPEFKPLIDDPINTYVYDPETKQTSILLDEVVVNRTRKTQTSTSSVTSDPLFWINTSLGFSSVYVGYKANFHLQNEVWHKAKNGKFHNVFEKSWKKSKYRNVRANQTSKLQLPRNVSNGLAAASLVMIGVNVYKTGELKASDVLYATMAGASFTGVGSVVAGIFFIADFATMGVSYLATGEAKSIGNYLDENTNGGVILNKDDF